MTVPTNRADAKRLGATHYFTGVPCKQGHVALRKTKGVCVECVKAEAKAAAPKRAAYFAAYNKSAAGAAAKARYYETNKDYVIARAMTRSTEDLQRYRAHWKLNNPEQVKADTSNRRRRHREATPSWVTRTLKTDMRAIYQAAMDISKLSGESYVVDHIIPLRSETVCGLHVPWNLRVITRHENAVKSNSFDEADGVAFPDGAGYKGPT